MFLYNPTVKPGPENKPSVGEKERLAGKKGERIDNNTAIIMSLAPKLHPAEVFRNAREGVFLDFVFYRLLCEQEGSSSGVLNSHLLVASTFLPVCSSQNTLSVK